LIVDGTGPRGGQGMELLTQAAGRLFSATYEEFLDIFETFYADDVEVSREGLGR